MKRIDLLTILLVLSLLITQGCMNPNRNNPANPYDWCEFVEMLELQGLGVADCDEHGWSPAVEWVEVE